MVRRQPIFVMLGTISFLAMVVGACTGVFAQTSPGAGPDRSAGQTRPNDKAPFAEKPASARKLPSGKSAPFAPEKLLRAFRGNREDARHRALDEIERSRRDDSTVAPALWRAVEPSLNVKHVPDSLLRAIRLYSLLDDDDGAAHIVTLLTAADPRIVLAAIDLVAERRPPEALRPLMKLREHPGYKTHYGLRHAVVSAVAKFDDPASVDYLVSGIATLDGQVKYVAARQLARLTGQNFGGQSDKWRQWWDANRKDFRVATASAARGAPSSQAPSPKPLVSSQSAAAPTIPAGDPIPWDYPVPQFFGTPIYAKRVVFVIDKSKSMLSSVDGVTRLDDAQKQLEGAIRGLPDDAWFEIIAYNDSEQAYSGRLTQATPSEKSSAARFLYSLSADGKTDIFDTLFDALAVDPNLEAILLLSDGDPNVGSIVDKPTIVQRITQQNAARRISINTIGIDAQGAAEEFLKRLAADNFGEYRQSR